MKIELISWRDACSVGGSLIKQRHKILPLVHTVGVFEHETDDYVLLKSHWAEDSPDEFETVIDDEAIAIPKTLIVKRRLIRRIK